MSAVHFSSSYMSWRTPRKVFDDLHDEFRFTVDGCSTDENALLDNHWTEYDEPLLRSWAGERVFINPPYGREIARWMEKAWTESPDAEVIVALVPSRTDTAWWHDYVMPASEIRFIRGRLEFEGQAKANPQSHNAPFPSCVVIWEGSNPASRSDEAARLKINKMRELGKYSAQQYWWDQADFWEELVEQFDVLRLERELAVALMTDSQRIKFHAILLEREQESI